MTKRVLYIVLILMVVYGSLNYVLASDVKGHWSELKVNYLMEENIINGYPDGSFRPENSITRAEFIKVINGALRLSNRGIVSFNDVSRNNWFYNDISIAVGEGYLGGYADNTVKPNGNITREEASVMIGRALKLKEGNDKSNIFKDSNSIATWSKGYINAIYERKYITGYPDGSFRPKNNLKRAEVASILIKVMGVELVNSEEMEVFRLINIERQKAGLKPFILSDRLSNVARLKSKDMGENNYFSHTSPVYGSPFDMMKEHGITYRRAGENIAYGYKTPKEVVVAWMNSPGHKANINNSGFGTIGIGYHVHNGTPYWTQMFTD